MKKIIFSAVALIVCVLATSVFTSCESKKEKEMAIPYQLGFGDYQYAGDDFVGWLNSISDVYKAELGIPENGTSVTLNGTISACDKQIIEACQRAEATVRSTVNMGRISVSVTNEVNGRVIYSAIVP